MVDVVCDPNMLEVGPVLLPSLAEVDVQVVQCDRWVGPGQQLIVRCTKFVQRLINYEVLPAGPTHHSSTSCFSLHVQPGSMGILFFLQRECDQYAVRVGPKSKTKKNQ